MEADGFNDQPGEPQQVSHGDREQQEIALQLHAQVQVAAPEEAAGQAQAEGQPNFPVPKEIEELKDFSKRKWQDFNIVVHPGYHFSPHEHELIEEYLRKKIKNKELPSNLIYDIKLSKYNPYDLAATFRPWEMRHKAWYFFTPRERKYCNGTRPDRASGDGFWKATGADKAIYDENNQEIIGQRKSLVFYVGHQGSGKKTNWIMQEYRIDALTKKITSNDMRLDDWVLVKIYKKSGGGGGRNNQPLQLMEAENATPQVTQEENEDAQTDRLMAMQPGNVAAMPLHENAGPANKQEIQEHGQNHVQPPCMPRMDRTSPPTSLLAQPPFPPHDSSPTQLKRQHRAGMLVPQPWGPMAPNGAWLEPQPMFFNNGQRYHSTVLHGKRSFRYYDGMMPQAKTARYSAGCPLQEQTAMAMRNGAAYTMPMASNGTPYGRPGYCYHRPPPNGTSNGMSSPQSLNRLGLSSSQNHSAGSSFSQGMDNQAQQGNQIIHGMVELQAMVQPQQSQSILPQQHGNGSILNNMPENIGTSSSRDHSAGLPFSQGMDNQAQQGNQIMHESQVMVQPQQSQSALPQQHGNGYILNNMPENVGPSTSLDQSAGLPFSQGMDNQAQQGNQIMHGMDELQVMVQLEEGQSVLLQQLGNGSILNNVTENLEFDEKDADSCEFFNMDQFWEKIDSDFASSNLEEDPMAMDQFWEKIDYDFASSNLEEDPMAISEKTESLFQELKVNGETNSPPLTQGVGIMNPGSC